MTVCHLALGGNLGEVEGAFRQALQRLSRPRDTEVVRVSSIHRTPPVGESSGSEFLNAAAAIRTELPPLQLLDRLQQIETELGRTRGVHWGPRTIDLDLLLYGEEIVDVPRLRVPHPACWYRRFVLDPLAEIAGEVVHPERCVSIGELRDRLLARPLPIALAGGGVAARRRLAAMISQRFAASIAAKELPNCSEFTDAALTIWLGKPPPEEDGHHEGSQFASLPLISRLDASGRSDVEEFVRDVLASALGGG